MANVHNGSTGQLNPSVEAVARACGITACQARRHLHALIEAGYLQVVGNANGGPPTATRNYRLNIDTPSADATPRMDATPSTDARDPSHPCTRPLAPMRVTPSTGASRTVKNRNEPEVNRKEKRAKHAPTPCPPDVDLQIWIDWNQLRKAKKAPVTSTVVDAARSEAAKAGMTFNAFLKEWCVRGTQGLKAEWLRDRHQPPQRTATRADLIAGAAAAIFEDATHV